MKRVISKFKPRYLYLSATLVILLIVGLAYFYFDNQSNTANQNSVYNFNSCTEEYGLVNSNPPKCYTEDGRTYVEFKIKGKTFEECVREGGKVVEQESACIDLERKYIKNVPTEEVSSYNECQEKYDCWRAGSIEDEEACVDKNGLVYIAGGPNRLVNNYAECVDAGGPIRKQGSPKACYYDKVMYWQNSRRGSGLHSIPPEEILTFSDCVKPGVQIKIDPRELSCTAFNNKKYFYDGPPIDSYERCAEVMRFVLTSNPPQCYGPDGTHFVGPRS